MTFATTFRALHTTGAPLDLVNVWDAGSARAVQDAGAPALATSSWAMAAALGYGDDENLPLDLMLTMLERITAVATVPVSADIEAGYGATPDVVAQTVQRVVATGVVGINLQDTDLVGGGLRSVEDAAARVGAAVQAGASYGLFVNARTDVFFDGRTHDEAALADGLERATAYAAAGAEGVFVPGLAPGELLRRFCAESPLPVNVMVTDGTSGADLAAYGVARVSRGPAPYLAAVAAVAAVAGQVRMR